MTQEEKDLLLRDLCARLPYGVKCKYYDCYEGDYDEGTALGFEREEFIHIHGRCIHIEEIKPYLFPLSSMTEEQKIECFRGIDIEIDDYNEIWSKFPITNNDIILTNIRDWLKVIDWLNKNHFDYRGLIPKGLALDATGLSIYN